MTPEIKRHKTKEISTKQIDFEKNKHFNKVP